MKIKIYKTIILPAVLYGCETWSLTLREESSRWAGHVARMEECRSAFKILTGKPTGKRRLGRRRRRWEDNIRMDLEEIGINAGKWVDSVRIGIIGEPL